MIPRLREGDRIVETRVLTILHVSADIHTVSLASYALVFGISHWRATDIPSSIVGVVGGCRGIRML